MSDESKKEEAVAAADVATIQSANPEEQQPKEEGIRIEASGDVIFNLKILEFDNKIAQAEMKVAELKSQRAAFIYDMNLETVVAETKKKKSS